MAFYGPSTPLKACQGPAHTTHRLSISHQALTLPPHASLHHHQLLHAYWLYRVCLLWLYGGISDVLKELFDDWDNDASWSELSQRFIANRHTHAQTHGRKPDLAAAKQAPHPRLGAFACASPAIQSHSVLLTSLRIIRHTQVCHRGDVRHRVSPAEQPFHAPA